MSDNSQEDPALQAAAPVTSRPRPPGLTPAQKRFLKAFELECDPTGPSLRILGKLQPGMLARWMRHRAFRARLEVLLKMVASKRRMTLQVAAGRAADRLDASFDTTDTTASLNSDQRRTCLELLKLAEGRAGARSATAQVRQTRTAKSAKSGAPRENSCPPSLAHPDVPAEEAQALRVRLGAVGGEARC